MFSPYTQPQKPAEWVDPLDLNLYLKGSAYKQQVAEGNLKRIQDQYESLFSVPSYGIDSQRLSEIEQNFRNDLSKMDLGNLSDLSSMSNMNNLINKYTSNNNPDGKDLIAIAKRGNKFKAWEENIRKFQEKGQQIPVWNLKSYNEALNYYEGDNFETERSFSGDITPGFDWDKHNKEIENLVPEKERMKKSGFNQEYYKGKTYQSAFNAFMQGLNQPGALEDLQKQFEYYYGNEDYGELDKKLALQQIQELSHVAKYSEDEELRNQAINNIKYWEQYANTVNPTTSKQQAFEHYKKINADNFAQTVTNYGLKDVKLSEDGAIKMRHNNEMELIRKRGEVQKSLLDTKLSTALQKANSSGTKVTSMQTYLMKELLEKGYDGDLYKPNSSEILDETDLTKILQTLNASKPNTENEVKSDKVREDLVSFKEIYSKNKNAMENIFKQKAGNLGYFFDVDDIEEVTWNNETKRYEVTVDDAGTTEEISFTQEEVDELKTNSPQPVEEKENQSNINENPKYEDVYVYGDQEYTFKQLVDHYKSEEVALKAIQDNKMKKK